MCLHGNTGDNRSSSEVVDVSERGVPFPFTWVSLSAVLYRSIPLENGRFTHRLPSFFFLQRKTETGNLEAMFAERKGLFSFSSHTAHIARMTSNMWSVGHRERLAECYSICYYIVIILVSFCN